MESSVPTLMLVLWNGWLLYASCTFVAIDHMIAHTDHILHVCEHGLYYTPCPLLGIHLLTTCSPEHIYGAFKLWEHNTYLHVMRPMVLQWFSNS